MGNTFLTIDAPSPTTPSSSPEKARTVPSAQRTTMCPALCSAGRCLDTMCRFAHDEIEFNRFHAWENRFHMDTHPVQSDAVEQFTRQLEKDHAHRAAQNTIESMSPCMMMEPCGPQSPLKSHSSHLRTPIRPSLPSIGECSFVGSSVVDEDCRSPNQRDHVEC